MTYKRSKHGSTDIIKGNFNNLGISWDYDYEDTIEERVAVLLYTPHMQDTDNHYHIPLNLKQAKTLHKWLGEFIKEKEAHESTT